MIRKKYFIPFLVVLLFLLAFRFFFLDYLLKVTIEKSFSSIPKLTFQVGKLKLYILKGDLLLTDVAMFMENLEEATVMDKVLIDINTPQLLRGKFVIRDMELLGVQVVPKKLVYWEKKKKKKDSLVKKEALKLASKSVSYYSIDNLSERFEINKLLDVSKANFMKVLNQEIDEVRASYDAMQKVLASGELDKRLGELEQAIKRLEKNKPTDLLKLPQYLQEISSLNKEYEQVKKAYEAKSEAIKSFQKKLDFAKKNVENAGKLDLDLINSKFKFAENKKQSLASDFIGSKALGYIDLANKGVEALKTLKKGMGFKQKKNSFKGIDITFPIKDSYPIFYINNLKIEGKDKQGNQFKGTGQDITHKQNVRKLPSRLEFSQNLGSVVSFLGITVDLREDIKVLANGFTRNKKLSSSYWDIKNIPLQITEGLYDVDFVVGYKSEKLFANIKMKTNKLKIQTEPAVMSKPMVERYLFESLGKLSKFSFTINLDGDKLSVDSNLDEYIASASQALVNKEIEKVKQNFTNEWQSFVKEQEEAFKKEVSKLVI